MPIIAYDLIVPGRSAASMVQLADAREPTAVPESRLADAFATPERKRAYNRALFSTIAGRYDLITVLLSYGRDRQWKRRLVELAAVGPGERALDLACGTADLALLLADAGARVIGVDLTLPMLRIARRKDVAHRLGLATGDMTALPVASGAADVVTAGYGLRNVPRLDEALREISRVLRPGGRFLSLDFNRPRSRVVRAAYLTYLTLVGSALGWLLHRDADTYRYIAASLRRYPDADTIVSMMHEAGLRDASWIPVLGGLMAIHVARKPRRDEGGQAEHGR